MKRSLLLLAGLFFVFQAFATHIIGGTLTYEFLGGSTYRINQRLYKDCQSAGFPASISIEVRDSSGAFITTINIPYPGTNTQLNSNACFYNTNICIQEANYIRVVNNLPARAGGYHLFFQYCCRSTSLLNVQNPLSTGDSWNTYIPDNNIYLVNSSPQWAGPPPVFTCVNQQVNLSFQATDPDGDSLVHSFYNPYTDDAPSFPNNIATFTPFTYVNGYGTNYPCGPVWNINPTTGLVTGPPPNIGMYSIGIKVEEYRGGVKIGEIIRDINLNGVTCPAAPLAAFTTQDTVCLGSQSIFTNQSVSDSLDFWDFGVNSTLGDTAITQNSNYTYTQTGNYIVTLIINNGYGNCSDTVTDTIHVVLCTGMKENSAAVITIAPNPASQFMTISSSIPLVKASLMLMDVQGREVMRMENISGNSITIQRQGLDAGIYFYSLRDEKGYVTKGRVVWE